MKQVQAHAGVLGGGRVVDAQRAGRRRDALGAVALATLLALSWPGAVLAEAGTAAGSDEPAASDTRDPDPWIGLNRVTFGFNKFIDRWILKPVAKTYDFVMPDPMQRGVSNFFDNLLTPWSSANQFLQGKPRHGMSELLRFGLNTTVGVAGVMDVATAAGVPEQREDFGQTLVTWGLPRGPYFVIPLLGPSTVTFAAGRFVDSYGNPIRYVDDIPVRNTLLAFYIIDTRARLLDAETLISGDEYLFVRDAFLQSRDFAIGDGEVKEDPFLDEEFDFDE